MIALPPVLSSVSKWSANLAKATEQVFPHRNLKVTVVILPLLMSGNRETIMSTDRNYTEGQSHLLVSGRDQVETP